MIIEHHQERRYRLFVTMLVVLAVVMIIFPVVPRSLTSIMDASSNEKSLFSAPVIPFAPMPATEPVTGITANEKYSEGLLPTALDGR